MVEFYRLAEVATARGTRFAHLNMMDVPELVEEDETHLTPNALIKAFHSAQAPPPPTPAVPATTAQGSRQRPGWRLYICENLQEGLRKQAVDNDRRFSQMADQIAHLAGSMERIEGLLRSAPTATGTWSGSTGAEGLSSRSRRPEDRGSAANAANRVTSLGSAPMVSKGCNLLDAAERALVAEGHFGGQTTKTRDVCLDVQIQGLTRTCLLDTGSERSLFPAGLVPPGTEIRSMNGPMWAANGSKMNLMEEVRLETQLEPRRFAVDFVLTPQVNFPSW